jgi:hypothetical protein
MMEIVEEEKEGKGKVMRAVRDALFYIWGRGY